MLSEFYRPLIVYNPLSGSGTAKQAAQVFKQGMPQAAITEFSACISRLPELISAYNLLIVFAGDGSQASLLREVLAQGGAAPIAFLLGLGGGENVLAKVAGTNKSPDQLLEMMEQKVLQSVSLRPLAVTYEKGCFTKSLHAPWFAIGGSLTGGTLEIVNELRPRFGNLSRRLRAALLGLLLFRRNGQQVAVTSPHGSFKAVEAGALSAQFYIWSRYNIQTQLAAVAYLHVIARNYDGRQYSEIVSGVSIDMIMNMLFGIQGYTGTIEHLPLAAGDRIQVEGDTLYSIDSEQVLANRLEITVSGNPHPAVSILAQSSSNLARV